MANATKDLVDYLFSKQKEITETQLKKAEACLQDYKAVTFAGAKKNADHWARLSDKLPSGNCELIGYSRKTDSKTAALINGFNAHTLELDDGQRFAMIHLGASVISAIKAVSDENTISKKALLTGIVMGYEAACRVAIAMQPSHKNRGHHTAGTCGTIGAAVGTAFSLEMSRDQMNRVITCAAGSSAGMLQIQENQSELKPYNVGRAAMDGITAAYMGYTDYQTPDDMIGGERGFFKTFSDIFDTGKMTGKEDYFEIERIYVKPYASCRHSHSAVEAAIMLHNGLNSSQIDQVVVETYRLGVKGHDHTMIQGVASAKLSTPYAVAAALLYGKADLSVFEPLDASAVELAKKVAVTEKEELTLACPQKRVAIVTVIMTDGTARTAQVDYAKGEPENPMTEAELKNKEEMLYAYLPMNTKEKTI